MTIIVFGENICKEYSKKYLHRIFQKNICTEYSKKKFAQNTQSNICKTKYKIECTNSLYLSDKMNSHIIT